MNNPPCPRACDAGFDHYHQEEDSGVWRWLPCDGILHHDCDYAGAYVTRCYSPAVKHLEPMFTLPTVEALIRAALADEQVGLGAAPSPRCLPDEDEAGYEIAFAAGMEFDYDASNPDNVYRKDARAVLELCESQPTVKQVWEAAWLSCCLRSGVGCDEAYGDFLSGRPWE